MHNLIYLLSGKYILWPRDFYYRDGDAACIIQNIRSGLTLKIELAFSSNMWLVTLSSQHLETSSLNKNSLKFLMKAFFLPFHFKVLLLLLFLMMPTLYHSLSWFKYPMGIVAKSYLQSYNPTVDQGWLHTYLGKPLTCREK